MAGEALPAGYVLDPHPAALPAGYTVDPPATKAASAEKTDIYTPSQLALSKVTMGLSDKAQAGLAALYGTARDAIVGGATSATVGSRYHDAIAGVDAAKAKFTADHPILDWATSPLNLIGVLGAAPEALAAKTAAGIVGRGAVVGATYGAVSGVGNARGSYADQVAQTGLSAGLGAAGGAVLAKVVPASINALQRIRGGNVAAHAVPPTASATDNDLRGKAQSVITRAMAADGTTPLAAGQQIAAAADRGVPLSLADTGDNVRGLAASMSRLPGPGKTIMRDALISRQEGQTERVQGAIARDLGPTVGTATEAQRLEETAAATAAPLYEKAHPQIVDDPAINKLLQHPEMQSALAAGKQMHADDTFLADVNGTPTPSPLPTQGVDVRTLDYAKRALDRKIEAAYSGDGQSKMQLPILKGLRSTLLTKLDAASPDYAAARAAYAGPMQSAEALAAGKAAVNKTGDEIAAETSKLTPGELDQYRLGHRSALSDKVASSGDYADTVNALVGSPKKRDALNQLYAPTGGVDNLLSTLSDERAAGLTYKAAATGSPTAGNLANDTDSTAKTALGIVGKFGLRATHMGLTHNVIATVRDIVHAGAGKSEDELRAQIASALSETDPVVLATALRQVRRESAINARRTKAQAPIRNAAAGYAGRVAGAQIGGAGQ